MIGHMCGSGKIRAQKKTARTVRQHRYPGLRPRSDQPGRSPGHMMPRAGRAALRAAISRVTPATPGGGR